MTLEDLMRINKAFFAYLFSGDECSIVEDPVDGATVLYINTMHSTHPVYSILDNGKLVFKRRSLFEA